MKHLPVILSLCLTAGATAQTLVPVPGTSELPDSLLEVGAPGSIVTPSGSGAVAEGDKQPASTPDIDHGDRPEAQPTPDEGISIQVEKPTAPHDGTAPSGEVKVFSPWPAKPMFPAPEGWKFAPAPEGMEPYRTKAKLSTGQEVSLSITPFVLVPVTDGLSAIRIVEPGYKPGLGYVQRDTLGVMLQKSNADLEQNEQQAAKAIERLQQLLSSLPQTNTPPAASPASAVEPEQQ